MPFLRLLADKPVLSTTLLVVGAFAPSAAWFWLPPVYLLTAAVVIIALVTSQNRPIAQPNAA